MARPRSPCHPAADLSRPVPSHPPPSPSLLPSLPMTTRLSLPSPPPPPSSSPYIPPSAATSALPPSLPPSLPTRHGPLLGLGKDEPPGHLAASMPTDRSPSFPPSLDTLVHATPSTPQNPTSRTPSLLPPSRVAPGPPPPTAATTRFPTPKYPPPGSTLPSLLLSFPPSLAPPVQATRSRDPSLLPFLPLMEEGREPGGPAMERRQVRVGGKRGRGGGGGLDSHGGRLGHEERRGRRP